MALIEFHDVYKSFGPKMVYAGLSLSIERGEAFTILGGSGVGKSVMLKMLIGLLKPDKGEILFDGESVRAMDDRKLARLRQRVGMVFQGAALFDSLSVRENVAYGLREHFHMNEAEIDERVAWALALVGLPGVEHMNPSDLSGGMRKRTGLARTIALKPEVLLYDEPTTGLDPIMITAVDDMIAATAERLKVTSIVISHDMASTFRIAHRVAMLFEGQIIAYGTPEEIRRSQDERVRRFIFVSGTGPLQAEA